MTHGKLVWSEDECTRHDPDHETIGRQWRRRFGEELDAKQTVEREDAGDTFWYRMRNGYVACLSYDGWYVYAPAE